ncbi:unnamed protein product [Polarella glacialis]|uniref:Uncharacterized protein n=1 Tax=Polarella glacialis TaxID=89957 RepID=A0A813FQF5_POLGL|nr:unnamed protein product [Polarella glacialis]
MDLQATGYRYWCDVRYSHHKWEDDLEVPHWECKSPRAAALGYPGPTWSSLNASGKLSETNSSEAGGRRQRRLLHVPSRVRRSEDDGRRADAKTGVSVSGLRREPLRRLNSTSGEQSSEACIDDDVMLARVVHKVGVNVTCAGLAGEVCDGRIGLSYCRRTCGFCAPYEYQPVKPYEKPQVSLLPVVMYQRRFEKDDCRGFALDYETQPFNSLLKSMPALDGVRLGRVLTCINRRKHQETEFAFELTCPPGTVNPKCVNGKMQRTSRFEFHNQGIYAEMIPNPKHDIEALKTMNWLDLQSDEVVASTMIYTEGAEVFTTLSVHFQINRAGEVVGTFKLMSYKDLIHQDQAFFVACMATTCVLSLVTAAMTLFQVRRDLRLQGGSVCKAKAYEITCGTALAVYCIILLVSWSWQVPMSVEFLKTLHSFLDLRSTDTEHRNQAMQTFFNTKEHMYKEIQWSFRHRITAYAFLYTQFVQLVFHFNAHPKMALLTSTFGVH